MAYECISGNLLTVRPHSSRPVPISPPTVTSYQPSQFSSSATKLPSFLHESVCVGGWVDREGVPLWGLAFRFPSTQGTLTSLLSSASSCTIFRYCLTDAFIHKCRSQAWWSIPIIPAPGRQRHVDLWVPRTARALRPCLKQQQKRLIPRSCPVTLTGMPWQMGLLSHVIHNLCGA